MTRLVSSYRTLQRNQVGQLRELLLQEQPPESVDPPDLIDIYRLKAADYCYVLPFELGALVSRQPRELIDGVRSVLLDIGAAPAAGTRRRVPADDTR